MLSGKVRVTIDAREHILNAGTASISIPGCPRTIGDGRSRHLSDRHQGIRERKTMNRMLNKYCPRIEFSSYGGPQGKLHHQRAGKF